RASGQPRRRQLDQNRRPGGFAGRFRPDHGERLPRRRRRQLLRLRTRDQPDSRIHRRRCPRGVFPDEIAGPTRTSESNRANGLVAEEAERQENVQALLSRERRSRRKRYYSGETEERSVVNKVRESSPLLCCPV